MNGRKDKKRVMVWVLGLSIVTGVVRADDWIAFGDSITSGLKGYISYIPLLESALGQPINNRSLGGSQLPDPDQIGRILSTTVSPQTKSFILTGYNDMRTTGSTNTPGLLMYSNSLTAASIFLCTPRDQMVLGMDTTMLKTGTWAKDSTFAGLNGIQTTENGATATAQVTGTSVYVCAVGSYYTLSSYPAFSVTIDGVNHGVINPYSIFQHTVSRGTAEAPLLLRYAGLNSGDHTITLKAICPAGGTIRLEWICGSGTNKHSTGPTFYLGNCLRMTESGYFGDGGLGSLGSDSAVATYNRMISSIAADLTKDGLDVRVVDVSSVYDPYIGVAADLTHPNAIGKQQIVDAFMNAFAPAPTLSIIADRIRINTETGRSYQLQASHDLTTWSNKGESIEGNGLTTEIPMAEEEAVQFHRVKRTVSK